MNAPLSTDERLCPHGILRREGNGAPIYCHKCSGLRSNLVELLRDGTSEYWSIDSVMLEAADEIEQQSHRLERIKKLAASTTGCAGCTAILEEIAHLSSRPDVPAKCAHWNRKGMYCVFHPETGDRCVHCELRATDTRG